MNFRSFADLNTLIASNLYKIPHDIDVVVGIPRSGLLVACMIALYLNLPVTDLDSFLQGKILPVGRTRARSNNVKNVADCTKVLVVDDSVNSGKTLYEVKNKIESNELTRRIEFTYMAIYASEEGVKHIDLYLELCPKPRYFEWNIMNSGALKDACVDIDGVLCRDPSSDENDDGDKYIEFLNCADPLFLPSQKIKTLVTCRLEKYRAYTENWLQKHQIDYEDLIMMPYQTKAERVRANRYAQFKAEAYTTSNAKLFIESSYQQASEIFSITGKPVLCIENSKFLTRENNTIFNIRQTSNLFSLFFITKKLPFIKKSLKKILKLLDFI